MIFRFYNVYNKLKMIYIDNETREKSQVLLNNFAADCIVKIL